MLKKERPRVNQNMRIGIIHTAFIGDIVLSGLLIEALHRAGHEIVFFTKPKTRCIYESDIRITQVISLDKSKGLRKLFNLKNLIKTVRSAKVDILICPHRSFTTTLCAFFSAAQKTIGFKNAAFSFLYSIQKPFYKKKHECLRYLELLTSELCSKDLKDEMEKIGRPILRYEPSFIEQNLPVNLQSPLNQKEYFVLAIGSAWNTKKYKLEYFKELCAQILLEHPNLSCYLTGDMNDKVECEYLRKELSEFSNRLHNYAGQMTLQNLSALIAKASFVISNDSSPVHFASAFNTPSISFFGPTIIEFGFGPTSDSSIVISHKTEFGEYLYCQPCGIHGAKKCPEGHHLCMKTLTPERIAPRILRFLKTLPFFKRSIDITS